MNSLSNRTITENHPPHFTHPQLMTLADLLVRSQLVSYERRNSFLIRANVPDRDDLTFLLRAPKDFATEMVQDLFDKGHHDIFPQIIQLLRPSLGGEPASKLEELAQFLGMAPASPPAPGKTEPAGPRDVILLCHDEDETWVKGHILFSENNPGISFVILRTDELNDNATGQIHATHRTLFVASPAFLSLYARKLEEIFKDVDIVTARRNWIVMKIKNCQVAGELCKIHCIDFTTAADPDTALGAAYTRLSTPPPPFQFQELFLQVIEEELRMGRYEYFRDRVHEVEDQQSNRFAEWYFEYAVENIWNLSSTFQQTRDELSDINLRRYASSLRNQLKQIGQDVRQIDQLIETGLQATSHITAGRVRQAVEDVLRSIPLVEDKLYNALRGSEQFDRLEVQLGLLLISLAELHKLIRMLQEEIKEALLTGT